MCRKRKWGLSPVQTQKPYTFFITPSRLQSKTLILSTNADQKSIKQGFLLSFVARLAIVNTVSCDYYPRSSIVKSVFNCRLPGMFNLNTTRALCIAWCCFVFKLWVNNSNEENYNCNCTRNLASGTGFTNSLLFICNLLDSNDWIYH